MYLRFYGLNKEPFHTTPDPRFLFLSPSHKEALGSIIYGIEQRKGFIAVIGEVGVGKTTILRTFLENIDAELDQTIYIYNPNLTFNGLLQCILRELEQEPNSSEDAELVRQLQDVLIKVYRKGGTVVLLIDEAQNMPLATLENLRMLSNLETTTEKLLQILLIGQPELETLLNQQALRQLRQRITIRATIRPLSKEESHAYIQHRLAKSSVKHNSIFTSSAQRIIVREARGIPRRLNILCDNALITGFGYQKKPITEKIAREVIADLNGKPPIKIKRWIPITAAALLILSILAWFLSVDNSPFWSTTIERVSESGTTQATGSDSVATDGKKVDTVLSQILPLQEEQRQSVNFNANTSENSVNPIVQSEGIQGPTVEAVSALKDNNSKSSASLATSQSNTNFHTDDSFLADQYKEISLAQEVISLKSSKVTANKEKPRSDNPSNVLVKEGPVLSQEIHAQSPSTNNISSKNAEASSNPSFMVRTIQKGDTLDKLITAVYGSSSPERVKWILEHNPHIRSPRKMFPGQDVLFPKISKKENLD